jgi:aquaporin Z
MSWRESLREHWPEYLIEAWALGTFMVSAGVFTTLLEAPGSALHQAMPNELARRTVIGIAMGLTAVGLIYSPWGRRSGAHMNPAVTLAFLHLGKIARQDAICYVIAQFAGGILGVLLATAALGHAFTDLPVRYAVTLPGSSGVPMAVLAEFVISALMMTTVLALAGHTTLSPYNGWFAGLLVALFITLEAPLSGMSMNPARSMASAGPALLLEHLWIYLTAPVAGMLAAARWYSLRQHANHVCAKIVHTQDVRCIHCGFEPGAGAS